MEEQMLLDSFIKLIQESLDYFLMIVKIINFT